MNDDHADLKLYIASEFSAVRMMMEARDRAQAEEFRAVKELMTLGDEEREKDIKEIKEALNGNGQPGLVKTVAQHEIWIKILSGLFSAVASAAAVGKWMGVL